MGTGVERSTPLQGRWAQTAWCDPGWRRIDGAGVTPKKSSRSPKGRPKQGWECELMQRLRRKNSAGCVQQQISFPIGTGFVARRSRGELKGRSCRLKIRRELGFWPRAEISGFQAENVEFRQSSSESSGWLEQCNEVGCGLRGRHLGLGQWCRFGASCSYGQTQGFSHQGWCGRVARGHKMRWRLL